MVAAATRVLLVLGVRLGRIESCLGGTNAILSVTCGSSASKAAEMFFLHSKGYIQFSAFRISSVRRAAVTNAFPLYFPLLTILRSPTIKGLPGQQASRLAGTRTGSKNSQ